jgi:hypothetical protein
MQYEKLPVTIKNLQNLNYFTYKNSHNNCVTQRSVINFQADFSQE